MIRSALAMLSTLQIGARIKQSFERSLRQAVVIAIAAVFLAAAMGFGLMAAYHALVMVYQFDAIEAAGIIAVGLLLVGILIIATLPLFGRKPKRPVAGLLPMTGDGAGMIDQGFGKAMQQVGPMSLLAIAFLTGLLVSRR
jgi:hypothetical protein